MSDERPHSPRCTLHLGSYPQIFFSVDYPRDSSVLCATLDSLIDPLLNKVQSRRSRMRRNVVRRDEKRETTCERTRTNYAPGSTQTSIVRRIDLVQRIRLHERFLLLYEAVQDLTTFDLRNSLRSSNTLQGADVLLAVCCSR